MSPTEQHIRSVTAITGIAYLKSSPPGLLVSAAGETSSSGWSNPRLIERQYVTPPSDGIMDFDFVADPPTQFALQMITPTSGHGIVMPMPDWVRGVRVHGRLNHVERVFDTAEPAMFESDLEQQAKAEEELMNEAAAPVAAKLSMFDPDNPDVMFLLPEEEEGAFLAATDGRICRELTVLGVSGWPEVKTEWVNKCILSIGGKCKASTKIPKVYRRTSRLTVYAQVCFPNDDAVTDEIEDCLKQAIAAGILAGAVSGNLAAVGAAVKSYVVACLKAKLGKAVGDIDVTLRRNKIPGAWKPL